MSSDAVNRIHKSMLKGTMSSTNQFSIPDKVDEELNEETENEDGKNEHDQIIKQNQLFLNKDLINLIPTDSKVGLMVTKEASGDLGDEKKDLREDVKVRHHRDSIEDTK